ncbi:MAG: LuxR C-terminal-related transcriptional regulator [Micrococcales bacterium]|nr:LuxR C-terminal-related transcriptional regulator [Micrococcales bacterium]
MTTEAPEVAVEAVPGGAGTNHEAITTRETGTRGAWPRSDDHADDSLVREIVDYLHEGVSVNLVGLRGSGRTHLLRKVVDALKASSSSIVEMSGVLALRDRPLAALAVAGVTIPSANTAGTVAAAVSGLLKLVSGRRPVLVIDDADDLDGTSAGAIVAAHVRQAFTVVSVTRISGRRPHVARTLTAELQPSVRVVIGPLHFDELHSLVHSLLPGTVDASTVARIATESGGLPGLVRAIVNTGRRTGQIAQVEGRWVAPSGLWNDRSSQVVEPLLSDLDDDDVDALTRLSLLGTVRATETDELIGTASVTRLDEVGLLRVIESPGGAVLGVFPPLVTEYLRREGSPTCRLQVREYLKQHSAPGEEPMLMTGLPTAPPSGSAALLSRRLTEHWETESLRLRRAWLADPTPTTALPLLVAMHAASASTAAIDEVLSATPHSADDPNALAVFEAWGALYHGISRGDPTGAAAILAAAQSQAGPGETALRVAEAQLSFLTDRIPDSDRLLSLGGSRLGGQAAAVVAAEALLADGRTADASLALAQLNGRSLLSDHASICRGLELVLAGSPAQGVQFSLNEMVTAQEALNPALIQGHAYVAALGMVLSGRLRDLDQLVDSVLPLAESSVFERHYQAGLLTLASIVAGWGTRTEYANNLALQAVALDDDPGPFPAMLGTWTPLMNPASPPGTLWDFVDNRLDRGYLAAAVFAAVPAAERIPDPARAAAVAHAGGGAQSPVLRVLSHYIAAAAAHNLESIHACVGDLRHYCGALYAMRAGISCALLLRHAGRLVEAAEEAEAAWREGGDLGSCTGGLFTRLVDSIELTSRERDAVTYIYEGLNTHRVASLLNVSTRTVENHLFNAYRKIGVENRQGLRRAMSTWLELE